MGLKLTTDDKPVTIFAKEKQYSGGSFMTYSMGVSSKDKEGNWVNGYLDCLFRKGVTVNNKSKIKINNAFPVVSMSNERAYVKWFIMDFDVVDEGQPAQVSGNEGFSNVPDDGDLPFAMPSR